MLWLVWSLKIRPGNAACVVVAGVTPRQGDGSADHRAKASRFSILSAIQEEHIVQDPNVLLTMLNRITIEGGLESRIRRKVSVRFGGEFSET